MLYGSALVDPLHALGVIDGGWPASVAMGDSSLGTRALAATDGGRCHDGLVAPSSVPASRHHHRRKPAAQHAEHAKTLIAGLELNPGS